MDDVDALALAELIRNKKVSSRELVDEVIARIERVNPELNAIVTPMYEQARARAAEPPGDGPFAGVPYLLKDILAKCEGVRFTSGSRFLQDYVADGDSVLVERLRKAGFVFVAKTNTPEFGFLPTTEPALFGASKNPWDTGRTTGGSSGGSAAAVAAGIVPAAHANDGGGSIRIPASCCGLFGLKPTRGRTSLGPDLGDIMSGLVVEHAVTRSVRDSAAILDATLGPAPGDSYFAAPPTTPYLQEVSRQPGKLKIAVSKKSTTGVPVHADCLAAVEDAAKLCEELGHVVEEQESPISGDLFTHAFIVLWTAGAAVTLEGVSMMTGRTVRKEDVEPLSWALAETGRSHTAPAYVIANTLLQRLSREVARVMQRYDAWLCPTLAEPPVPLGSFDAPPDNPLDPLRRAALFSPFTPLQNVTGEPAMTVPLFWNADGLPIGVQFSANYGDEATLFRLAAQLERARPWKDRRPAVHC